MDNLDNNLDNNLSNIVDSSSNQVDAPVKIVTTIEDKVMTLSDLVNYIVSKPDEVTLPDDVRRFKLMIVKNSLTEVITLMEASNIVKQSFLNKVKSDIDIYPLTTQLQIWDSINSIIDRSLKIVDSVLPRTEDLSAFLAASKSMTVSNHQLIDIDGKNSSSAEKITQIVESVILQLKKA